MRIRNHICRNERKNERRNQAKINEIVKDKKRTKMDTEIWAEEKAGIWTEERTGKGPELSGTKN